MMCNSNLFLFFSDDLLSLSEFTLICRALFRNDKGHIYSFPVNQLKQTFDIFDKNQDGFIDRDEFQFCWNYWIKTVRILKEKNSFRICIYFFLILKFIFKFL